MDFVLMNYLLGDGDWGGWLWWWPVWYFDKLFAYGLCYSGLLFKSEIEAMGKSDSDSSDYSISFKLRCVEFCKGDYCSLAIDCILLKLEKLFLLLLFWFSMIDITKLLVIVPYPTSPLLLSI